MSFKTVVIENVTRLVEGSVEKTVILIVESKS